MNNHINFYDFMELWHWKNKPLLVMDKLYLNDEFDTVLMELSDHHKDTLENIKQYDIEFEFAIFPEFSPLRCSVYIQPKYIEAEVVGVFVGQGFIIVYLDMRKV